MKKNISLYVVAASALTALFTSCYTGPVYDPYIVEQSRQEENLYYVPSAPNTQLLSEKNDLDFNLTTTGGTKFSGVEMQASYLPAKHIGIIGSYSSSHNKDGEENYMTYHRVEGGIGYVTKLSKSWHFETYAGLGTGNINNSHATGSSKIDLTHYFVQPGIAVSNPKKTVQLGFVSKFSGVDFKVDTAFDNAREPYSTSEAKSLYDKSFHIMWEPGLVFRFGWKNFMFHTSYFVSSDLTNSSLHRATDIFSIGGSLRLNTSSKNEK